jgi:hypothetical protein
MGLGLEVGLRARAYFVKAQAQHEPKNLQPEPKVFWPDPVLIIPLVFKKTLFHPLKIGQNCQKLIINTLTRNFLPPPPKSRKQKQL